LPSGSVWDFQRLCNGSGGFVTVSVGSATALSRVGGTTRMPEGLLVAADGALYKAKHNGATAWHCSSADA
jgi:GGDEF domain-containing protein